MSFLLQDNIDLAPSPQIENHLAWIGNVSGLTAEKLLKERNKPYHYILRAGEREDAYYVSFVADDYSIKHIPFVITSDIQGWYSENGSPTGPFTTATIDDIIHLIMHCGINQAVPYIKCP